MLRKTTAAVVLAGALALGTASATSLGTFSDIGFAASDVGLLNCEVLTDNIDLLPDLDADLATLATEGITTFPLDEIVVDIPTDCVGMVADVVLISTADGVLETLTGTTAENGVTLDPLTNGLNSVTDIAAIDEVRIVVREDTA